MKLVFLDGDLHEEVYVELSPDFQLPRARGMVYKLKKVLYGLKLAHCAWNECIDTFLRELWFRQSTSNPNLYLQEGEHSIATLIVFYVDDLIITGGDSGHIKRTKKHLMTAMEFEMTNLGLLRFFLGHEILQNKAGIFTSQRRYVQEFWHGGL